MANIKTNTDNRYYNKLININQKSFAPIFTESKFIVSQNYNNGSWIIVSEKSNFANTYQSIDINNVTTQGTLIAGYIGNDVVSTKNYIHEIYLGGEHIAGGFGVASVQLRDNITYVGNTYNAVFSYHVDSRTKLSLSDVPYENYNSNSYAYISNNDTILGIGLQYTPIDTDEVKGNTYTLGFTGANIYNYGLIWDNPSINKRLDGYLEEEFKVPDMMHEYDVLWDEWNYFDTSNVNLICNSIIHYGIGGTDSNAVKVAGPLRRSYNNLKTSPYTFRYYYTIDTLYDFFHDNQLDPNSENDIKNTFISVFGQCALYDSLNSDYNELYFYRHFTDENMYKGKHLNECDIKIKLDLSNCYFEIDLNNFVTENISLIRSEGINMNIYFLPRVLLTEDGEPLDDNYIFNLVDNIESTVVLYYQYKPSNFVNKFVKHTNEFEKYKNETDKIIERCNAQLVAQQKDINKLLSDIEELKNQSTIN